MIRTEMYVVLNRVLNQTGQAALYVMQDRERRMTSLFACSGENVVGEEYQTFNLHRDQNGQTLPVGPTEPAFHIQRPSDHGLDVGPVQILTLPVIRDDKHCPHYLFLFEEGVDTNESAAPDRPVHLTSDGRLVVGDGGRPFVDLSPGTSDGRMLEILKSLFYGEHGSRIIMQAPEYQRRTVGATPTEETTTLSGLLELCPGAVQSEGDYFLGIDGTGEPVTVPGRVDYIEIESPYPDPETANLLAAQALARNQTVHSRGTTSQQPLLETCRGQSSPDPTALIRPVNSPVAPGLIVWRTELENAALLGELEALSAPPTLCTIVPPTTNLDYPEGWSGVRIRQPLPGWGHRVEGDLFRVPKRGDDCSYFDPGEPLREQTNDVGGVAV